MSYILSIILKKQSDEAQIPCGLLFLIDLYFILIHAIKNDNLLSGSRQSLNPSIRKKPYFSAKGFFICATLSLTGKVVMGLFCAVDK